MAVNKSHVNKYTVVLMGILLILVASPMHIPGYAKTQVTASLIDNFLATKGSLMVGEGEHYLKWGEYFNVDPRLVVAISGAESTFGKYPCGNEFNVWGWMYGGSCWSGFEPSWDHDADRAEFADAPGYVSGQGIYMETGYEDGIFWVTRNLRLGYLNVGLDTVAKVGNKWCQSGCANWEPNVTSFITQMGGDPHDLSFGHNSSVEYKLPYPGGVTYRVSQGNNSSYSHTGKSKYAFDFAMPVGSDVVAAAAGKVVLVKEDSNVSGGWESRNKANYVVIEHSDGYRSLYLHLEYNSVLVNVGQFVQQGQKIAHSGKTGYCTGAHLHFHLQEQGGGSWWEQSVPISFFDVSENGGVPLEGHYYTSGNYYTTPIQFPRITSKSLSTSMASPGQIITFNYTIYNPNSTSVKVTLGAQIRTSSPQGNWIDDYAHDEQFTVSPGTHNCSRQFQVPPNGNVPTPASPGWYDANWVIYDPGNPTNRDEKMASQALKVQQPAVPKLCASPGSYDFGMITPGSTPSKSFVVSNCGSGGTLNWKVASWPSGWLNVTNTSGTNSGQFIATVKSNASVGSHSGTIHVNSNGGSKDIFVSINIQQATGFLRVTISPQGAITAGAQWRVKSGSGSWSSWYNSGYTKSGLPVGSYAVEYKAIQGWTKPGNDTGTIYKNQTATESGTYTQDSGSLRVTINPSAAVSAGTQWRVIDSTGTTSSWYNSGYTKSGLPVGSYTVEYKAIQGWTKPGNDTGTIYKNQTATESGTYTQDTGSLRVTISPQGAITAGAQWRVKCGSGTWSSWYNSGYTKSGLPVGSYTVEYKDISDWSSLSNDSGTIYKGQTATESGPYSYSPDTGSLRVTITPQAAIDAGAQWRVKPGSGSWSSWYNNGYTKSGLPVGSYTVEYKDISGWSRPSNDSGTIQKNQTSYESGVYSKAGTYTIEEAVARHSEDPNRIETNDLFWAINLWAANAEVPGTSGQKIDTKELFHLIDLWANNSVVSGSSSTESNSSHIAPQGNLILAEREISQTAIGAGDTFRVRVNVQVGADVRGLILRERLPKGWGVIPITPADGGFPVFKPSTGEWLLGTSAEAGESKRITYQVRVPKEVADGVYQIKGVVSTGTPRSEGVVFGPTEIKVANTTLGHIRSGSSPSNNGITFTYELRQAAEAVEIEIYDLSGRRIVTLPGTVSIGQNEIFWNGCNEEGEHLANGVYIYRINVVSGNEIEEQTGKLTILR